MARIAVVRCARRSALADFLRLLRLLCARFPSGVDGMYQLALCCLCCVLSRFVPVIVIVFLRGCKMTSAEAMAQSPAGDASVGEIRQWFDHAVLPNSVKTYYKAVFASLAELDGDDELQRWVVQLCHTFYHSDDENAQVAPAPPAGWDVVEHTTSEFVHEPRAQLGVRWARGLADTALWNPMSHESCWPAYFPMRLVPGDRDAWASQERRRDHDKHFCVLSSYVGA